LGQRGQRPWDTRPLNPVSDKGGLVTTKGDPPYPEDFSEQDFQALQEDVRTILRAAAGDNMGEHPLQPIVVETKQWLAITDGSMSAWGGYFTRLVGPWRDQFLFLLLDVLRHEPPDRILRCSECRMLFVRAYTQVYCSRRCTNRASVRHWRQRQETAPTE